MSYDFYYIFSHNSIPHFSILHIMVSMNSVFSPARLPSLPSMGELAINKESTMNVYQFPLTKKFGFAPRALATEEPIANGVSGKFIFSDGKSCDVSIVTCIPVESGVLGIEDSLRGTSGECGCAIVANGDNWYQVEYHQTSRKA